MLFHSPRRFATFVGVTLFLMLSHAAHAQPKTDGIERSGLAIGGSLGGGAIIPGCDGCTVLGGPAVEFHVGAMLSRKFAVLYDGSGVVNTGKGVTPTASLLFAAAGQYFVAPRVWLKGGLGLARLQARTGLFGQNEENRSAFGVLGAAGYEFYQSGTFAVDTHLRCTTGFYAGGPVVNLALLAGVNWY